jgi:hypothetical protein
MADIMNLNLSKRQCKYEVINTTENHSDVHELLLKPEVRSDAYMITSSCHIGTQSNDMVCFYDDSNF